MASVVIREYSPTSVEDAKKMEQLEKDCSNNSAFVQVHKVYQNGFHFKAQQFEGFHILYAEDTQTGQACGSVSTVIKTVKLDGKSTKVAYLFDVRVRKLNRRQGIAEKLSKAAEELCLKDGAVFMYLTVNGDNKIAYRLYEKTGFINASNREIVCSLLTTRVPLPLPLPAARVEKVSQDEAAHLVKSMYTDLDMAPTDVPSFLKHPRNIGTYVCRDKDSVAGVSLWHAQPLFDFDFDRVLIPTHWVSHSSLRVLGWGMLGMFLAFYLHFMYTLLCTGPLWQAVSALCVSGMAGYYLRKALRFLWRLSSAYAKRKLIVRQFAPFFSGPNGLALLQQVLAHTKNVCKAEGYLMVFFNVSPVDPIYPVCNGDKRFRTIQMIKSLREDVTALPFKSGSFFDPRDIA
eukprot:GILJ01004132.1.p1 GENE.GILJ01004132.1~~GILJ01004132.1.p1  ORF type:complete len:402 (-),score=66.73 GILJ01004132.1:559-1764(-)